MKEVVELPVLALFEDVLRIVQEGSEEYNDHSPALSYPKSRVSFQLRQLAEDDWLQTPHTKLQTCWV